MLAIQGNFKEVSRGFEALSGSFREFLNGFRGATGVFWGVSVDCRCVIKNPTGF